MPDIKLIPSVELRLASFLEINRRREHKASSNNGRKPGKTITISREYGCEAYTAAEFLRQLMEKNSGEPWMLMDKKLLEEIARNHDLSSTVLKNLGVNSRFLDEVLATFSSKWKSEMDHFKVLCRHILSLAEQGNMILIGQGSSVITQALKNCAHFRLYASKEFKVHSIVRRLGVTTEEAENIVSMRQKQRNSFIHDFLEHDAQDLSPYNIVFNNDKNSAETIAYAIADYVAAG
ncbi:MAG: cytidylate kinase family protein [Oryzomonas sp.]|uniref:cytidylate kinase-like family protein n=1 Tax=Oryzomonas sp. TaxID=2855186 RepID=UPI00284C08B3|nr:cytidylate kinase family protein [Oryzomonas sp.]MDR3580489.1 cytidylate kinase family protein [Oryzomonas sp.]